MKKVPRTYRVPGRGGSRLLSEPVGESECGAHEFILGVFGICLCAHATVWRYPLVRSECPRTLHNNSIGPHFLLVLLDDPLEFGLVVLVDEDAS